ncbi:MAG: SdrD B-like domain-containing protein [Planctomycetaceae bacterium]
MGKPCAFTIVVCAGPRTFVASIQGKMMNTNQWLTRLKRTFALSADRRRQRRRQSMVSSTRSIPVEMLEDRMLLAGADCLGQIEGITFQDLNGNDMLDGLETRLSNAVDGVVVHLYEAGPNGDLDSTGGVAGGDDTFVGTQNPNAQGEYTFAGLAAGTYFVEQPTPAGFIQKTGGTLSGPIVITALEAQGTPGITIDDFGQPIAGQSVDTTAANPNSSFAAATAVGGERDLFVERTSGSSLVSLFTFDDAGTPTLGVASNPGTTGLGIVSWDGVDGNAVLNTTGLNGLDLTSGGTATGFQLTSIGDLGGTLTIRVHSGSNMSEITTPVPNVATTVFLEFANFTTAGTAADFTSVGAVELQIQGPANFDGQVSLFGTLGPNVKTANFANYIPMTLGGTVFNDANNDGVFQVGTEVPVNGVNVTLFQGDGVTQVGLTTQTVGGDYSFTNLFPGDYIVRVDANNFAGGGALENLMSSTGNGVAPDPDDNVDHDDNGDHVGSVTTDVVTQAITLVNNAEPSGATNNSNTTVDFGFFGTVDVVVTKTDGVFDPVTAGSGAGNLVYTITASNNGPGDATGVVITDALIAALPAGWTLVGTTQTPGTSFNPANGQWTVGNLPAGAGNSRTLTVTITVGASAMEGVTNNTALVTALNETDSNPANDSFTENTTVVRSVDIAVTKVDDVDPVVAGSGTGNLTYTVTAQNIGLSDATGVVVTDALIAGLPTGWVLDSFNDSGTTTFTPTTGIWNIGNLPTGAPAETLTLTFTVGVTAAAGTTTNTVNVTAVNETDLVPGNNTASEDTTVGQSVDIAVSKVDNVDPVTAGSGAGNLTYTVTATNLGPSNATGVVITDALMATANLPTGWTLASFTDSGTTTFDPVTGVWTIGTLNSGAAFTETLTLTITVGPDAIATTTTNTARVTGVNEPDTNALNDIATEDTTVNRLVDIAVTKVDSDDPITAGSGAGNLVYTITATNFGPSDASGVVITDALIAALPVGFTLESFDDSGTTTFDAGTGVWTIGSLGVGAGNSESLTVTLTVGTMAANGTITNTAIVTNVNENDPNAANDTANEDTTIAAAVDIEVLKSDSADPITAGSGAGNLTYTVTATNLGPSIATGVTISDALIAALPTGWALVSATGSNGTTFNNTTGIWDIGTLDVGALNSETLTVVLTVGSSAVSGTIDNIATVASVNENDTNAANDTATEDTTVIRSVDIGVTKSDNIDPVTAGSGTGNLVYTVTAINNGVSDASSVTISDALMTALPTGFSLVSAVGDGGSTFDQATGIWTIGDLAAGDDRELTLTLTVGPSAVPGTIMNTVQVASVNETDTVAANDMAIEDTTVVRSVDIGLVKSDNNVTVTSGSGVGNLTYTITATNNGHSDATGVTVSDALITALPTGVTLVSATGTNGTTFNSTTGIWTIGNLNTGDSEVLTVILTVGLTAVPGTISNVAVVNSVTEPDPNPNNDQDTEDTPVIRTVDVDVTKSDNNDPITAGSGVGNLVYTVTARNNGPSNATGVVITDALIAGLPTGFSLVSAVGSNGTTFDANTGIWTIGNLNTTDIRTLTVTLTVGAGAASGTITNTAMVTAVNEMDSNLANNTASEDTTVVRRVDIEVTKTDNNDPVTAGSGPGNLIYTVTARNNGLSHATGVAVTDALIAALPTGFSLVSAVGTGGSQFNANTGVWTIGNLSAGDVRTLTVTLTVGSAAAAGTISNVATVSSVTETDTNPANNSATENTTVIRRVDIGIMKVDVNDPVVAGSGIGNLSYVLTATNNGPSPATGVTVTDAMLTALPAGVMIESATGTGGSTYNSTTGVWTIGNLAAGDSRTLNVTLTVGAATVVDTLTNVARVTNVNETDANPNNDVATAITAITRQVDLVVSKTELTDPIQSPGVIRYLITVANNGPSAATNVMLTDALSSLVTFGSVTASQGTVVHAGGVIMGQLGTIPAGQEATVDLIVNADLPNGATVNNVVSVTSDQVDSSPNNNMDSESTVVLPGLSSISGVVYQDLNGDGVQNPGEAPIPNTLVGLFGIDNNGNQIVRRQLTGQNGAYTFGDLPAGRYGVFEVQPGIFNDGAETNGSGLPVDAQNDAFLNINLGAQQNAMALNFGEGLEDESKRDFLASHQRLNQVIAPSLPLPVGGTGTISGTVALDRNGNGLLDAGDSGIAAATVTLVGTDVANNPILVTRTTAADGSYVFSNLPAGSYSLLEAQPAGYVDGPEQPGNLMVDAVLDDLFATIALPDGGSGTGFNFLERVDDGTVVGTQAPVLAAQAVEGRSQPVLSWAPVANAARYDAWLSQVTGGVGLVYRNESVTGTSLQVPIDLNPGEHRLWVRSIDASGNAGPWSSPRTMHINPAPRILSPGTSTSDVTPTFDFTDVVGADGYDLMVYNTAGQEFINAEGLTTSEYSGSTTLPIGTYRAWTRTRTDGVAGPWSEGTEFSVTGPPTLVAPISASTMAPSLLEWSDTGAAQYEVWLNRVTGGTAINVLVTRVDSTAMLLPEDLGEGLYRFWVRGLDENGIPTSWSNGQAFTVSNGTTVLGPHSSDNSSTPTMTWKPVAGATHYDVWVSNSSGLFLREQNATGTSHTFAQTFPDGNYRVWVKPMGVNQAGVWSEVRAFTVGSLARPTVQSPSDTTTDRTPTIRWGAVTGATRYELWVNHEGVTNKVIYENALTTTSFTPATNLAAGNYRIWVRAISDSGLLSAWSSAKAVTIS